MIAAIVWGGSFYLFEEFSQVLHHQLNHLNLHYHSVDDNDVLTI
jgi:hypothetical protein